MEKTSKNGEIISGYYDAMAGKYTEITKTAKYSIPKWLNECLETVVEKNPYVLDLGCANGYLGGYVKRKMPDSTILGVDISPKMIEELKKTGIYQEAVVWDLSEGLPFVKQSYFDLIISIGFLEFIADPAPLFSGICQSLKPHGQCFASFEAFDNNKCDSKTVTNTAAGFPRYLYSVSDIEALAGSSGLKLTSHERIKAYVSPTTGESREYLVVTLCCGG